MNVVERGHDVTPFAAALYIYGRAATTDAAPGLPSSSQPAACSRHASPSSSAGDGGHDSDWAATWTTELGAEGALRAPVVAVVMMGKRSCRAAEAARSKRSTEARPEAGCYGATDSCPLRAPWL